MGVRGEHGEPVAIIGVACRFPGAGDPAEFHDLIVAGRSRFEPTAGVDGRPLHAALLDDWTVPFSDVDGSGTGEDLGPVQKLAAETAALALADAGLREAAGTSRTGLIIASSAQGVCEQIREQFGVAAGGPYPDAAYRSSLHAVAGAASALQAGLVDLAVAGGVELGINLAWLARQAGAGALGTDEMRVYAADPSGLLPGEGCGMVVLVRAADARAGGVPVYAELAGWSTVRVAAGTGAGAAGVGTGGVGTGGVGTGGPALAQAGLLRAYERAGIDPAEIQLIEGTGLGTAGADAAEIEAFAQLRQGSQATAALSAVSGCIGYTKAAAGIASLVKVAVVMAAGTVPPGPGCVRPHPVVESGDARLRWPGHAEPWPDGNAGTLGNQGPRLAAVNSLGTADPAELAGLTAGSREAGPSPARPRGAEGVHLVLRRDGEAGYAAGRRRRASTETVVPAAPGGPMTAPRPSVTAPTAPPEAQAAPPQASTAAQVPHELEAVAQPVAMGRARGLSPEVRELLPRVLAGLSRLPVGPQDSPSPPWPDERDILAARAEAERSGAAPVLPRRVPGSAFAARTVEHPAVFALCGADSAELAARLDILAGSATVLSAADLNGLARQLAVGAAAIGAELAASAPNGLVDGPSGSPGLLRVGLTAGTPRQLAAEAAQAAQLLRTSGPGAAAAGPGVRISAGAGGSVVVLFPGRADSVAGQSMQLVTSLQALDTLDALDVRPAAAVGYGLGGEIAGLAWAGCLPETEAARLVALCGQALRSCACGPAAMARVSTDAETARALYAPATATAAGQLHICAYEGPRSHVLTGPAAGIREMARRAHELGIPVEMITTASSLHSPAMTRCAAPLRGVFAGTCFVPPRRRVFSTMTGRVLTPQDDIARLLTQMVSLPVLFSQAMSAAAEGADLIVAAAPPDAVLTGQAAGYGVPAVSIPESTRPGRMDTALAQALAALFTAGAVSDLTPFLAPARPLGSAPWGTLASRTVPRMRVAEPDAPQAAGAGNVTAGRTAARSGKSAGQNPGLFPVRPQRHTGGPVRG